MLNAISDYDVLKAFGDAELLVVEDAVSYEFSGA